MKLIHATRVATIVVVTIAAILGGCGGQVGETTGEQSQAVTTFDFRVTGPTSGGPATTYKDTLLSAANYICVLQANYSGNVVRLGQRNGTGIDIYPNAGGTIEIAVGYGQDAKIRCAPKSAFPATAFSTIADISSTNVTNTTSTPNTTSICFQQTDWGDLSNSGCSPSICGGGGQYGSTNWQGFAIDPAGSTYDYSGTCLTGTSLVTSYFEDEESAAIVHGFPFSNDALCGVVRHTGRDAVNLDFEVVQMPSTSGYSYLASYMSPSDYQNAEVLFGCLYYTH